MARLDQYINISIPDDDDQLVLWRATARIVRNITFGDLASWLLTQVPAAPVLSVDGMTGAVDLSAVYQPLGDYVLEAPQNGNLYARQDGGWSAFSPGISDAPADGSTYARKDNAWSAVTPQSVAILQSVSAKSNASVQGSAIVAADGTTPQIGEGVAWPALDVSITPLAADSTLEVECVVGMTSTSLSGRGFLIMLFRDADADCIGTGIVHHDSGDTGRAITVRTTVPANAAAATTFHVRFAMTGSGVASVNRFNSVDNPYGGAQVSSMTVREIAA